ncbi:hypothetical protein RN001_012148 [Aquatica leii]|uniref:Uncharacterized protein n=1 Tax=Aquatica leii TaxID=1421715 RepID=A0AAN7P5H6_9COLE|nr:hypothetical protein RN001_012148 [Aquatica leii]
MLLLDIILVTIIVITFKLHSKFNDLCVISLIFTEIMEDMRNRIPTSEEVIDDLTKNFKQQTVSEPIEKEANDCVPNIFEESHSDEETTEKPTFDEDYIDEEELKKINENLTSEEKEDRLCKANELKKEGNNHYKNTEYVESIAKYSDALRLYPLENSNERSIVYSNRAASKIQLGYKETAIDDCTKSIELNPNYIRALLRRAKLFEEIEKLDESLEDYKKF